MNANVLVIDDELTVCRSCQKILGEEGYDVSMTLKAREGLEEAKKRNFDLVIVDLKMPDMDGMSVVEAIRKERPNTQVIIMTGYSTVASAVKGMKLGAADYIPKPFTPDEMTLAVKKALQEKKRKAKEKDSGILINKEAITAILARAAEDEEFAERVSDSNLDALSEYDLGPEEKAALVSVLHPSDEEAMLVVSHELKSPLSAIVNLARAMQEPNVAGDQKEKFLNRIIFRADGALGMISEYLTLSRISSGELDIKPRRVSLYSEVIEGVLDNQKEAMEEKGINAGVEIPRDLEVVCDPGYIQIVYNNLISNAIKYGTANTEIQIGYSGKRDVYYYFSVANVGEWIKESDRKRIFEKYVTLGKRGTGIGLHATREIVKKHGGDIWVEPCYFAKGKCIAEKSIIRKADDKLLTGNNFIFTIHEGCLEHKP